MGKGKWIGLFDRNGCLSLRTILTYVTKTAYPVQREIIENHLKHCALCRDAVRGYAAHPSKRRTSRELRRLSRRIRNRYLHYGPGTERKVWIIPAVAFTAVLVVFILLYLLYRYLEVMD